jgi:O-acetylserine/cysteine efflux transporter
MRPRHVALAVLVAVIWGLAFVATKIGLGSFSPPELVALRFLIAALPALVLPRPSISWSTMIPIGLTLFAGQFLLQFVGIASGIGPGLAAIAVQTQAFFTVLLASLVLHEQPTRRHLGGMALAFGGLGLIATTIGPDLTMTGLGATLAAAVSWAIGNILLKRAEPADMLAFMVWLSLIPPLPSLGLTLAFQGVGSLTTVAARASAPSLGAALYLGLVATVIAYAIWGRLLREYPAAAIAPFALLVPVVGAASSAIVFGERFGARRLAGMATVLLGLAVAVLPRPLDRAAGKAQDQPA